MNKKYYAHNFYMAEIGQCITNNKIPFSVDTPSQVIMGEYAEGVNAIIKAIDYRNSLSEYTGHMEEYTDYERQLLRQEC